jgi:tRNA dimethylallyltransferase
MNQSLRKTAVLIAGATASGKSALAMRVAAARGGVIVNADSLQVYRELRIVTARPSTQDELQVPHKLYGQVSGTQDYSVGDWLRDARSAIEQCWADGQVPVITGGTGLYFKALEEGLAETPAIPADIKSYWRDAEGDLHARLAKLDPALAARLNPADRQRIIRALEVFDSTGKSLLWWQEQGNAAALLKNVQVERIHVNLPREELHARAELRFDQMLAAGALNEVRALPVIPPSQPVMKAIGVPELMAHLAGVMTLGQAREKAIAATRQYIKRQSTWWRGQMKAWNVDGKTQG